MTNKILLAAASTAYLLSAAHAFAATSTIILTFGDDDCFGTGAPCVDGMTIDTNAISAGPLDGSTDTFGNIGTSSFNFNLSLAPNQVITSALFAIKVVGLDLIDKSPIPFGDAIRGTDIQLSGTSVFNYNPAPGPIDFFPDNEVDLISFSVLPASLNTSGSNILSIIPEEGFEQLGAFEDYAIDFARLVIETGTVAPPPPPTPSQVPLPASMSFALLGLGALVGARRLRK